MYKDINGQLKIIQATYYSKKKKKAEKKTFTGHLVSWYIPSAVYLLKKKCIS